MISQSYATKILRTLFGTKYIETPNATSVDKVTSSTSSYLTINEKVYLGLSHEAPGASQGTIPANSEPVSELDANVSTPEKTGYERQLVGGYAQNEDKDNSNRAFYESGLGGGVIENTSEIQFPTAKKAYGKKMKYWFLSSSQSGSTAYLWGEIKDILYKETTTDLVYDADTGLKYVEFVIDDPFSLGIEDECVVVWDDKEYTVPVTIVERYGRNEILNTEDPNTKYVYLGSHLLDKELNGREDAITPNDYPFAISYKIQPINPKTSDRVEITQASEGRLRFYTFSSADISKEEDLIIPSSHKIGLYGKGIEVKQSTVPTFYPGELKASIDVDFATK